MTMMCDACERGQHELCGMQTWCACDCSGSEDDYFHDDPYDQGEAGGRCRHCGSTVCYGTVDGVMTCCVTGRAV